MSRSGQVLRFAPDMAAETFAHGSLTPIRAQRALERQPGSRISFIDLCVVPPMAYVAVHQHAEDNEELYVIVSGEGVIELDGVQQRVAGGDVILNAPGGSHGLRNVGESDLFLVVIEVDH